MPVNCYWVRSVLGTVGSLVAIDPKYASPTFLQVNDIAIVAADTGVEMWYLNRIAYDATSGSEVRSLNTFYNGDYAFWLKMPIYSGVSGGPISNTTWPGNNVIYSMYTAFFQQQIDRGTYTEIVADSIGLSDITITTASGTLMSIFKPRPVKSIV